MNHSRSVIPLALVGLLAAGLWLWKTVPGERPADADEPSPKTVEPVPGDGPGEGLEDGPGEVAGKTLGTRDVEARPRPPLSSLAAVPDWSSLKPWQGRVTRADFLEQMQQVFTVSSAWREWFHVGESDVLIETGIAGERYRLRFAEAGTEEANAREWRTAEELGPAPAGRPLEGLRIAVDPGHLGGRWAKIEERWFQVGDHQPVREGDMTLTVARKLKPRLEALGAEVTLVRDSDEPLTEYRPQTLLDEARKDAPDSPARLAERLFYRSAEIRARAEKVNGEIRPDLVLCLHFNAESWGDPADPELVDRNHLHLLINGAYMDGELAYADQRYEMVRRIVEGAHEEEKAVSSSVAAAFAQASGLPPYLYEVGSRRALNIDGDPYLWARNLLANRVYRAPVVFLEPYVMNSKEVHARIQADDYPGLKKVAGKLRPSIYREYADSVVDGLKDYYTEKRLPAGQEEDG